MVDDFELLSAWRKGDNVCGDELIQRHFDSVCRFLRSKLGDEVEDLIQRTFLDLVESKDRVSGSFRGYLFAIARNRLFDHLRSGQRGLQLDPLTQSVVDFAMSPSEMVAKSEEERLLRRAMRHIPVDHQIALELTYWEGMDGPEIAVVLGISKNTVRSRLSRARRVLRIEVERLAASPSLASSTLSSLALHAGDDE